MRMTNPRKCFHCSSEIPEGAVFCPSCGKAQPSNGVSKETGGSTAMQTLACPNCAKEYSPPAPDYCVRCGYPLVKVAGRSQSTSPTTRKGDEVGQGEPAKPGHTETAPATPTSSNWTPDQPQAGSAIPSQPEGAARKRSAKKVTIAPKKRVSPRIVWLAGGLLLVGVILIGVWYGWTRISEMSGNKSAVPPCTPVKPDENYEEANRLDLEGDLRRDSYFKSGQEYTVAAGATFRIPEGMTLIIEPGARVKFGEGSKMVVEGTLLACGKSNRRILFTANTTTGNPGYWAGVEIRDADPETVIGHANFEYGGKDYHALLWVDSSDIHIEDLKFDTNLWYPLSLDPNSTPILRSPLVVENGPEGWEIRMGEMTSAQVWNNAQPYVVRDLLVINEGASLSISAGATVKFLPNAAINIKGGFSAIGKADSPIHFTSYNDGGDEGSPEPKPGDWVGLRFYGREDVSNLEHVDIAYGGQGGYQERGCLWMENANPRLVNVSVSACDGFAMSTDIASDPEIERLSLDEQDPLRRWELRGSRLEGTNVRNMAKWTTVDGEMLLPVITGWVGVAEDASLSVAPGLTFLFSQGDTGFWADGDLQANGERKEPILLTSVLDPEFSKEGGAQAGDWRGVNLKHSQAENTGLRYLSIRYAGGGGNPCLRLENASPTIQSVNVSECASYTVSSDALSQPVVEDLDIQENVQANLWEIRESNLSEPQTWEWAPLIGKDKTSIIRLVTGVITIEGEARLKLPPGLIVKFTEGKGFRVQGILEVEGNMKQPVIMTSWRDPLGGGEATVPQPGDWGGIVLDGAAGSVLSNLEIHYAGIAANRVGCLNLIGSQPALTNLSITDCSYYPITSDLASQPIFENLSLKNNQPADEWAIRESQLAKGEQRSWKPISGEKEGQQVHRTVTGLLTVEEGATLSIINGVTVKFAEGAGLRTRGNLSIEGERRNPVILTSWRDSDVSSQAGAQPGDWLGLNIRRNTRQL